jgi:uncharacterized protein YcnI
MKRISMLAALILAIAATALPAGAHVTISPKTVDAGSTDVLTFRCPNERSNTATIRLVIQLPPDTPLRTVTAGAPPGWHGTVALRDGVPDTVTWEGGSIAPGERAAFTIDAGPMPAAGHTLSFRAVQTYADGEVVRWIEDRVPGEPEPPFPAPVLEVR